jgi:hypothetical protein
MQKRESFVKDKFFWSFFSCLFLVQLVWLLAFWPGLATYDTLSQWQQAITGSYNNAHPFFFTLLMRLSNFLVGSPWLIAFLQITFFSFLISWILASLKRRGVSKGYIFLALFLYAFWPQFGIFNVTLWKDIFYTLSALWVSFLVYLSLEDKSLKNYRYLILLGSILPVLFRHNGIIFLVTPYLLLLLFLKTERALVLKLFVAAIVIYFAFAFGVSSILNVRKAPLVSEAFRIKVVASIYHQENPNLTDSGKNIFNKLITEKDWKANYDCAYVDNLYLNYFLKPRN